jgi:nitrogen fixation protein NifU and related proteins
MDIDGLYQETILDHSKRPRNHRKLEGANRHAEGYNPLCGDKVTVYLKVENDRVVDASFQGSGCAISTASASILTETLRGKTKAEAEQLFEAFHDMVTGKPVPPGVNLGKLTVFSGVCEYPARVKCASLVWHTMHGALTGEDEPISTE